ncbi:hypothetical protein [Modicisalibacter luteus]|uniref:hypothetical protein n=1 Tax=Modicisalibacter luteus TaxID=453962 RepID=UPI003638BCD6
MSGLGIEHDADPFSVATTRLETLEYAFQRIALLPSERSAAAATSRRPSSSSNSTGTPA